MKNGVFGTVEKVVKELKRQRASRQDLVADTRSLELKSTEGRSVLVVTRERDQLVYVVSDLAHRQIADKLRIPFAYYQKMLMEAPELLDRNVNNWFEQQPEQRMLRILDGNLRAFLSARYRRLDNLELLDAVLPVIQKMRGAVIESMDITDTHMYLKVINRNMKAEIETGDIVYSGFVISNSEVGVGAINVSPMLMRKVCNNGLIIDELGNKKYHAGKTVADTETAYELYSDQTMALDDATYFSKAADIVSAAADDIMFGKIVEKLKATTRIDTGSDAILTVEKLAERFVLNKQEQANVLMHFMHDRDYSLYGLTNAITRASQDAENYNRATEMEKMGGVLLKEGNNFKLGSKKTKTKELMAA